MTGKRKNKSSYDEYDSEEDEETDSRRGRPRIQDLNLNTYEQTIAMEVVAPEEIPVSFEGTYALPLLGLQELCIWTEHS